MFQEDEYLLQGNLSQKHLHTSIYDSEWGSNKLS